MHKVIFYKFVYCVKDIIARMVEGGYFEGDVVAEFENIVVQGKGMQGFESYVGGEIWDACDVGVDVAEI